MARWHVKALAQIWVALLLLPLAQTLIAETHAQAALSGALRGTPAIGLVIDRTHGQPLAAIGDINKQSAPGSILKPFFLAAALEHHEVTPQTTVFCRRNFHIQIAGVGGVAEEDGSRDWNVTCTHPQTNVAFTAKEALAYSCNRYFAELADRLSPAQAVATLTDYGLTSSIPRGREQKQLLVLGLTGVTVSPRQIASAYRKLALPSADGLLRESLVLEGLTDSVTYGMAHNAAVPGIKIAGKTGTASDPHESWSHGWFAGTGIVGHEEVVIVVYLGHGNGGDAARLAQHFFLAATSAPAQAR